MLAAKFGHQEVVDLLPFRASVDAGVKDKVSAFSDRLDRAQAP
jgi:hypothetical protein